jgi:hypothetical protein
MLRSCIVSAILTTGLAFTAGKPAFHPGEVWLDADDRPIQAHGGGILQAGDTWYWYGEDKTLGNFNRIGVSVYSSRDLYNWKREGVALHKDALPPQFRDGGICERPKVLYNPKTRQFVMWMHLDDKSYVTSQAGVAVSSSPTGPFRFVRALRPIQFDTDYGQDDRARQKELGGTYRDMNLFLDDDGRAYVFYSSEGNWTMYVVRLNADFTDIERPVIEGRTWDRILIRRMREAPAPFKFGGKYFLITSGCTGWAPNAASYAVASNILGPYDIKGNPVVGSGADTTFEAQSTVVLPAPGKTPGNFIFLADRWKEKQLDDSRYVWLPFRVTAGDVVRISWLDEWDLGWFDR